MTPTPWEAVNFVNHDGSPIKTKDEIIALISESVKKGDGLYLSGVSIPGDSVVICYTGNGPNAKDNAAAIADAVNAHAHDLIVIGKLVSEVQRLTKELKRKRPPESRR